MTPDELLQKIHELIDNKKTFPKLLSFAEVTKGIKGDREELRKAFKELLAEKKIKVHEGKNTKLIEILR